MKTRNWVLTALALLVAAIGSASDFPKMNVIQVEEDKALLAYSSSDATPLEITLTNDDGEILYFRHTRERYSEYKKVFDFSNLDDGDYYMCVNFGNRSVGRKISVNKESISVGEPQHCYEPCFKLEDKMLNISFFNSPQKPVFVNIYQNGQHIDGTRLGNGLTIQKRLDLNQLKAGEYKIVVSDFYKDHSYIAKL